MEYASLFCWHRLLLLLPPALFLLVPSFNRMTLPCLPLTLSAAGLSRFLFVCSTRFSPSLSLR